MLTKCTRNPDCCDNTLSLHYLSAARFMNIVGFPSVKSLGAIEY